MLWNLDGMAGPAALVCVCVCVCVRVSVCVCVGWWVGWWVGGWVGRCVCVCCGVMTLTLQFLRTWFTPVKHWEQSETR